MSKPSHMHWHRRNLSEYQISRTIFLFLLPICWFADAHTVWALGQNEQKEVAAASAEGLDQREVTVGMSGQITQMVLPGAKLIPKEVDPRKTPIVIRIDEIYPHGDNLRYDFTWFGLEPGSHDLRDYLAREDGSPVSDLPTIDVTVKSVLPQESLKPNDVTSTFLAKIGGYKVAATIAVVVWVAGLVAIIFVGRPQKAPTSTATEQAAMDPVQHIRDLIDRAIAAGELTTEEKADLDVRILNFWRERKNLGDQSLSESIGVLKKDEEAGPLLKGVEQWFYSRTPPDQKQIAAMLEPLSQLAASQGATAPRQSGGAAS